MLWNQDVVLDVFDVVEHAFEFGIAVANSASAVHGSNETW